MSQLLNLVIFACLLLVSPTAAAESVSGVNECRRGSDAHVSDGCSLLQVTSNIATGVRRGMSTEVSTEAAGSVGMMQQLDDHEMAGALTLQRTHSLTHSLKSIDSAVAEFARVVHAAPGASLSDNDDNRTGVPEVPGYQNCAHCKKAFWSKKSCMTVPYCVDAYYLKDPRQERGAGNTYMCSDEGNNVYARFTDQSEWSKRPGCALWMSSFMKPFRQKLLDHGIDLYADYDDNQLIAENNNGAKHERGSPEAAASVEKQLQILKDKVAEADVFGFFVENDGWFCGAELEAAEAGKCHVVKLDFHTFLSKMHEFFSQEGVLGKVPRPTDASERTSDNHEDAQGIAFGGLRPRTGYSLHDHATKHMSEQSDSGPSTNTETMPERTAEGDLNGDRNRRVSPGDGYSADKGNVANEAGAFMADWFAGAIAAPTTQTHQDPAVPEQTHEHPAVKTPEQTHDEPAVEPLAKKSKTA